ncbi:MAG: serine/threonine-protein kinase [Nannocystaceae bacterium]
MFGEIAPPLLPRYRLVRVLGRGAMGEVWQAHDPRLDRDVAVKPILPRLEGGMVASIRIAREARALARLTHPNVVGVYDVGSYDGSQGRGTFIVMELVHGVSLDVWLAQRRRSVDEILALFCQAGDGLAAAHAAGIVHRDFKPSNVLVGADGRHARVGDFGSARAAGAAEARGPARARREQASRKSGGDAQVDRLTETGRCSDAADMALEQHRRQRGRRAR